MNYYYSLHIKHGFLSRVFSRPLRSLVYYYSLSLFVSNYATPYGGVWKIQEKGLCLLVTHRNTWKD